MSVEEEDGGVVVKTEGGQTVRAKNAVVATNSPINDRVALHSKQAPYRTYAMALQLPRGKLPDALYWDTLDPYHYVRLQPGKDLDYLIVGGADHKSGEADDAEVRYEAIEAWIRNLVPDLGGVTHRWSGQVLDTIDYSAFSGRNPGSKNVYVHTGDSGQGMTHGVVGSLIIARMIMQGEDLWQELYGPERKTASALSTFISENLTTIKNLAEYVAPGEVGSFDEIEPGRGAIVRQGLKKVAAYRDEAGAIHAYLSRLHASRLPPALEFVRAVLGLPVPRVAVQHRRRSAERASNSSASGGGGRLQRGSQQALKSWLRWQRLRPSRRGPFCGLVRCWQDAAARKNSLTASGHQNRCQVDYLASRSGRTLLALSTSADAFDRLPARDDPMELCFEHLIGE